MNTIRFIIFFPRFLSALKTQDGNTSGSHNKAWFKVGGRQLRLGDMYTGMSTIPFYYFLLPVHVRFKDKRTATRQTTARVAEITGETYFFLTDSVHS